MNKHHSISVNFSLYFLVKNFNDCSLMIPCLRMWQSLHARACDDPNVTNFLFVTKTAEAFENKRLSSPARNKCNIATMKVQYMSFVHNSFLSYNTQIWIECFFFKEFVFIEKTLHMHCTKIEHISRQAIREN